MNVKFNKKVSRTNFYKEGTKLICFICFPSIKSYPYKIGLDSIEISDIEVGTSTGVYMFTFHVRRIYNNINIELDSIASYIILNNTIDVLDNNIFILHSSPNVFNSLARLKLSGVTEINPSMLLGDCVYNAKIVYDNPEVGIKDIMCNLDYHISILVYWDKNDKLHFAPYPYSYPLSSLLNVTNYSEIVRDMLKVKRPEVWSDDDYLVYETLVSNFDISSL